MTPTGQLPHPSEKILDAKTAAARFARPREGTLVFTNGCFDILHRGHIEYLSYARSLGDWLAVGLNTDTSVRRLKGPGRPVNPEEDRALILAALSFVDAVVLFGEDTPRRLIADLLPDVLVKGADYREDEVVGAAEVKEAGGRVVLAPLVHGRSTTAIIERTKEMSRDELDA